MTERKLVRLAAASGLARLVVAVLWGPSFSNDADRYTQLDGGGVAIDWTGSLGSPAPLTQLVWHLPHDLAIAVQSIVASVSWGLLAISIGRLRSTWRYATALAFFALAVTWSPMLLTFDAMPLTDSLALAGASLVLAVLIDRTVSPRALLVGPAGNMIALSGLLMSIASRPVNLIALAPMVSIAVIWRTPASTRRRWLSAVFTLAFTVYGVALVANSETGTNEENRAQNRLAMRASPDYLAAAEDMGMPECSSPSHDDLISGAEASYSTFGIGPLRQQLILPGDQDARDDALRAVKEAPCPELHAWTSTGGFDTLGPLWRAPGTHLRLFLLDQVGLLTPYSHDERLPIPLRMLDPVLWLGATLFSLAVATRAWVRGLARSDAPEQRRFGFSAGIVIAAAWALHEIVNWLADPLDLARHFLPVTTMLPFALLALNPERNAAGESEPMT